MVVHAMLAVAAAAAAPLNAAAPAETLLPVDAALARWDMAEARILARAMSKGAERCAVEGIIAARNNRLDEVSESLPRCLAILEQTHPPRAHAAFEALLLQIPLGHHLLLSHSTDFPMLPRLEPALLDSCPGSAAASSAPEDGRAQREAALSTPC